MQFFAFQIIPRRLFPCRLQYISVSVIMPINNTSIRRYNTFSIGHIFFILLSTAALISCSVTLLFSVISIVAALIHYTRMGWAVSDYFRYFTTLSNLTTALAAGFILPFAVNGIRRKRFVYPRWLFLMHFAGTICTTLTLLFALVFILPWDPAFAVGGGQKFLHIICPIAILIAFLLVEGGYLLTCRNTFFCLIPFLVYSLVYLVMVVILGKERGGWEDLYMLNTYVPFYLSLPALWLLSYGMASVIRIVSNRLAVMRKERLLSLWTEDMEPVEVNIEIYGLGRYNGLHDEKIEMSIPYDILEALAERYAMDPTALMKVYTKGLLDAVKEK